MTATVPKATSPVRQLVSTPWPAFPTDALEWLDKHERQRKVVIGAILCWLEVERKNVDNMEKRNRQA